MAHERKRVRRLLAYAAFVIGVLIVFQGVLGLLRPELFLDLVREFQYPPVIYIAAVVRIVFGLVLCFAAPASRAPTLLQVLGVFIVAGGLVTPYFGIYFAHLILGWWSDGGGHMVRSWAAFAVVLGSFIAWAATPRRGPRHE
jgi:hypothetical protein